MKTPTWQQIEEFCRRDGWTLVRETDHAFFRKVLPDGTVLETHRSFSADKTMSPGRFKSILRLQLRVGEDEFWRTLRTGTPARRPSAPSPSPAPHEAWVVRALVEQVGMSADDIARLTPDEARAHLLAFWSRTPQDQA